MKAKGAKQQTILLTLNNAIVRALGLGLRIIMSRFLGAEIMGITELAQSVHMVAITPLTSGFPVAISRLTARCTTRTQSEPLVAGLRLVRIFSFVLIPVFWLLSPFLATLMGDVRALPSLLFSAPCILVLGYSAALNGYCYGREWSVYPAVSELIEQCVRFVLIILLLAPFNRLTAGWIAAVPVFATLLAELVGLMYMLKKVPIPRVTQKKSKAFEKSLLRLALPVSATRLVQMLLRSWTAILIPIRLQQSGLSQSEAVAQLGMLNGMVMPLLMLPCIFTSALSMVALPRLAKAEETPKELKRILGLCCMGCVLTALACCAAIYALAPLFSVYLYRMPELTILIKRACPMALLFSATHLCSSVLSALGQQKRSFYVSTAVSFITLFLTWLWAGDAQLRIVGVLMAQMAGQVCSILLSIAIGLKWKQERQKR